MRKTRWETSELIWRSVTRQWGGGRKNQAAGQLSRWFLTSRSFVVHWCLFPSIKQKNFHLK